jgi:hypothetical protein
VAGEMGLTGRGDSLEWQGKGIRLAAEVGLSGKILGGRRGSGLEQSCSIYSNRLTRLTARPLCPLAVLTCADKIRLDAEVISLFEDKMAKSGKEGQGEKRKRKSNKAASHGWSVRNFSCQTLKISKVSLVVMGS